MKIEALAEEIWNLMVLEPGVSKTMVLSYVELHIMQFKVQFELLHVFLCVSSSIFYVFLGILVAYKGKIFWSVCHMTPA